MMKTRLLLLAMTIFGLGAAAQTVPYVSITNINNVSATGWLLMVWFYLGQTIRTRSW